MTQEPQKEYIITEDQIEYIEKNSVCLPELYDEIRSRPYFPTTAQHDGALLAQARGEWEKEDHVWMTSEEEEKRIRADEAKKENERVLNELVFFCDGFRPTKRLLSIFTKIQSLRHPAPQGDKKR